MDEFVPAVCHGQQAFGGGLGHILQASGQHVAGQAHAVVVLPSAAHQLEQPLGLLGPAALFGGALMGLAQTGGLGGDLLLQGTERTPLGERLPALPLRLGEALPCILLLVLGGRLDPLGDQFPSQADVLGRGELGQRGLFTVSYTHLTLPTNREV